MSTLVICMAGLNTRFHDVGFDIPKYLLPWENSENTIIYTILKNLNDYDDVILLPNKRDIYFKDKLLISLKPLGIDEKNIRYINDTSGQAHTAYIGSLEIKDKTKPFFIHNADTILIGRTLKQIQNNISDAYIDVFVSNNKNYSYVISDRNNVKSIEEKIPISPFASSGLYGFSSAILYKEIYEKSSRMFADKEMYISNLLTYMINSNYSVRVNDLNNTHETIVLGSPQEYGLEIARQYLK